MHVLDMSAARPVSPIERGRAPKRAVADYLRLAEFLVDKIDLAAIGQLGLNRTLSTKFWPAHTIVTYPWYEDLSSRNDLDGCCDRLRITRPISSNIYLHIPYCTGVCDYCAYSRVGSSNDQRIAAYLDAVNQEIELWCQSLSGGLPVATSLYLGGGTPTAIPSPLLAQALDILSSNFDFSGLPAGRKTCEVSPETVFGPEGLDKLRVLKAHGVGRISMGVQSFSDGEASGVRRRHDSTCAITAIENIRSVGFEDLNIDLMYGLPGQDLAGWVASLLAAVELSLPSITVHQLKVKARTQLALPRNAGRTENWSQRESLIQATLARVVLEDHGYSQMGVYRFVKDRHVADAYNQKNYKMDDLIGIGCSSYSYIGECQIYNISNQFSYADHVRKGLLPFEAGRRLTLHERRTRFALFGLRCGIDDLAFATATLDAEPIRLLDYFPLLQELGELGLVRQDSSGRLGFTPMGLMFANEIGAALGEARAAA